MRLTTLNIRKRYLLAGCCMADYMTDHWNYLEEGNIEKAECVLTKSLKLDALRKTLLRWYPVIDGAKYVTKTVEIDSGNYVFPFNVEYFKVNGMDISDWTYLYNGDNEAVFDEAACSINGFVSSNDDLIQVYAEKTESSPVTIFLRIVYDSDQSPVSFQSGSSFTSVTTSTTTTTEADYTYPRECLTDAQVLSVIKKIDELCECEC